MVCANEPTDEFFALTSFFCSMNGPQFRVNEFIVVSDKRLAKGKFTYPIQKTAFIYQYFLVMKFTQVSETRNTTRKKCISKRNHFKTTIYLIVRHYIFRIFSAIA